MNKFQIFDVINKLISTKNGENAINNILNGIVNSSKNSVNENNQNAKISNIEVKPTPKFKYSNTEIISILNNHDKISKQIDKDNKCPKT